VATFHLSPSLELGEDRLVWPTDCVGEDIETPAMGHSDHDVPGSGFGRALDGQIEHGDQHVQTFDRESFLPEIRLVQKAFECLDLGETL
jgi:hypothetical protein